jgi:uncharacterized protein (DUF2336 family)
MPGLPGRDADHPPEQADGRPLREGSHGAIAQSHADDEKTDDVIPGVAEKVEGIGLKRRRTGSEARDHFDAKHACIDRQLTALAANFNETPAPQSPSCDPF